jgi:hypothetical protein
MHQTATLATCGFIERACFECDRCFKLDKAQCRLSAYVGKVHNDAISVIGRGKLV